LLTIADPLLYIRPRSVRLNGEAAKERTSGHNREEEMSPLYIALIGVGVILIIIAILMKKKG